LKVDNFVSENSEIWANHVDSVKYIWCYM